MSFASLGDLLVSSGALTIPRTGRPVAELRLAGQAPELGARLPLTFHDGTTYQMAVRRSGRDGAAASVLLVGGAGLLQTMLPAKDYQGVPASLVVRDLLNEAGETPGELDLPTVLVWWIRRAGAAADSLRQVMERLPDRVWRVLPEGTHWAGLETWPAGPAGAVVVESAPQRGWYSLLPLLSLRPGVVLSGQVDGQQQQIGRVERVIHQVGRKLRTEVYIGG